MYNILQSLRDLQGVHGTFVSDASGQVVCANAETIYDATLLQQVSKAVASAVDSVKLLEEEWETITAQFSDGRLLVRSIPAPGRAKSPPLTLSVIADAQLNPSFATVAIRVAIGKIRAHLESNGGNLNVSSAGLQSEALDRSSAHFANQPNRDAGSQARMATAPMVATNPTFSNVSSPEVAGSGLSWSGLGSSSQMSASGVAVADAASSAALTACTKCLAKAVGPMAKVFVKDAIRKLFPNQPFAKSMLSTLIAELEKGIEDPEDAKEFRKSAMKLV